MYIQTYMYRHVIYLLVDAVRDRCRYRLHGFTDACTCRRPHRAVHAKPDTYRRWLQTHHRIPHHCSGELAASGSLPCLGQSVSLPHCVGLSASALRAWLQNQCHRLNGQLALSCTPHPDFWVLSLRLLHTTLSFLCSYHIYSPIS